MDKDLAQWAERFSTLDPDFTDGTWIDVLNRLREQCPVFYSRAHEKDDGDGFWALTRYEDVDYAHNHPEMYSSCPVTMPRAPLPRPWVPIESDPPLHKPYRLILHEFLSHRVQSAKEPRYREIAVELIEGFQSRGRCDLYEELCLPLPSRVIMDSFDIPEADRDHVQTQMQLFAHRPGAKETPEETQRIVGAASMELNGYLQKLLDERRDGDGEDVISILSRARVGGKPLTDFEIIDYAMLVIPAGFETTAFSLSYVFRMIAERPDVRQALIDDPSLIPAAIEEVLRYETPVKGLARTVVVDHEVGGVDLHRGDRVMLVWAAANRDPEKFQQPDEFVLQREQNRHFGFGSGVHTCSGIHMARVEMKVAVEEVLKRMPDYRIDDPGKVVEKVGTTWSLSSLPVSWDVAAD